MVVEQTVAQSFVFVLISYHDLPLPNYPEFLHGSWYIQEVGYFPNKEKAMKRYEELNKERNAATGWTYFGPFNSEEEAVAYLDQFGFTRKKELVEYAGLDFEEAWVWRPQNSDVKWQLRKISQENLQQWAEKDPGWRIMPLNEIPEDRLYPAVAKARKEIPVLEQKVEDLIENLRKETEEMQSRITYRQNQIKENQEIIRAHEQRMLESGTK